MKTTNSIRIILALLLNVTVVFSQQTDLSSIVDKYQNSLIDKNLGIGLLAKKDGVIYTASVGSHNLNENSVFNIGSATKTMTSILVLQEVEKGNLRLTDTIGSYLDPINNVNGSLTIQQLLAHESGLDEVIGKHIQDIFYAKKDSLYQYDLLTQIEKNNPEMIGKYEYCNTNYLLLGRIIENLNDQSYFDVLRERIFEPLQMQRTYPYVHKNLPNLATPMHEEKEVTEFLDYRFFANIAFAAGSVASTLTDMELFYTALFETEKLLKKKSLGLMLESGNETYGLGIFKPISADSNYFGHGGNNIGYSFRNSYNPMTGDLFMMFSNNRIIPQGKLVSADLTVFLKGEEITQFSDIAIETFKNSTGTYLLAEANLEFEILLEGDKMYLIVAAQNMKSELAQKDSTTLMDTEVGATLSLIEGNNNSLTFEQNGFSTTINRVQPVATVSAQE